MFRKMRRIKQLLPEQEARDIIARANTGILGVVGDDGYPYTVPVNHILIGDKIYFHSAKSGHKIDAIEKEPKVSFTFIDKDDVAPSEYSTHFRSAHVFGKAHIIEDPNEKVEVFRAICERFAGDYMDKFEGMISKEAHLTLVIGVDIEHITAKESMALIKQRK